MLFYAIDRFVLLYSGLNIHDVIKRFRKTSLAIISVDNNVFRTGKDFEDNGRNMIQIFNSVLLSIGWVKWDKVNCAYLYVCVFGFRILHPSQQIFNHVRTIRWVEPVLFNEDEVFYPLENT